MTDEISIGKTFERLVKMGYTEGQTAGLNVEIPAYAELAKKHGMSIVGTHYSFDKILSDPAATMALHDRLGTKNVGIGAMPQEARADYDSLMRFIDSFNKCAALYSKEGYKLTYHNHSFEFVKINGNKTAMDYFAELFDPENVSFVLDTCWVAHGGADIRFWLEKLAGRIDILHLKDIEAFHDESGNITQSFTEIGNGNIWWDGVLETAEKVGVKHYVVEQDGRWINNDPFRSLEASRDYLSKYMK
jgi:sugar phosphate isomerase/epimerase